MNIAYQFVNCCLFRVGPADMPASRSLLKITLLSYFVISVIINRLESNWNLSLLISLADILFMITIIALLLKFRSYQARYLQTLIAMAGTSCFFAIIGFPIMWWFYQIEAATISNSLVMIFIVILLFWHLMVMTHIFRQSLEVKAGTAAILSVTTAIMSLVVTGLIMSGVA